MTTIRKYKKVWYKRLSSNEVDLLFGFVLDKSFSQLMVDDYNILNEEELQKIDEIMKKRVEGVPIAYLTNKKEFYGREYKVNDSTLIPRPETELIVDLILKYINKNNKYLFLDIGTGSGNIVTSLACEISDYFDNFSNLFFVASDISSDALVIARHNFKKHCGNKFKLNTFNSDLIDEKLLKYILKVANDNVEIVLSANLPYVDIDSKKEILSKKDSEGLKYEPQNALWAEDGGLFYYYKLTDNILDIISKNRNINIRAFYEIDPYQTDLIEDYLNVRNINFNFYKDLAGRNRVVELFFNI